MIIESIEKRILAISRRVRVSIGLAPKGLRMWQRSWDFGVRRSEPDSVTIEARSSKLELREINIVIVVHRSDSLRLSRGEARQDLLKISQASESRGPGTTATPPTVGFISILKVPFLLIYAGHVKSLRYRGINLSC